jgi:hypothetical protein
LLTIEVDDIHRIGGSGVENLQLKAKEAQLNPPGISVLKAASPAEAVRQIREAFPNAEELQEIAQIVASTSVEKIRSTAFDIIANPTRKLPNHHRIIHPDGADGFTDENLQKLAAVFVTTTGY